ncbi:hypothetical protein C8F04DRAFT_1400845 [Mycena alexandri]|uniref:Uncharacterized protein n=1 Tax=Mycena alexandri TaxID=1745969 RepID=A0AAD6SDF3_9AGAR|nr:hypothetical protein C8F04DRAFT_1400845 [Mycena alexandri]
MVDTLHNSGKFRPLVAMMLVGWLPEDGKNVQLEVEAVPGNIRASQSFEKAHPQLVSDNLNAMYAWADKPLKNFDTSLKRSAEGFPVFPLSPEALDDTSPKTLAQTVTSFLRESYETAFGSPEIPWASVASHPDKYYDTDKFQFDFPSSGLAELTRMQWDTLATALALRAGKGTSGFFRPAATVTGEEAEEVRRMRDEEARREQEAEDEAEARRRQAEEDEARRTQAEAEAEQAEEAHRKQVEEEAEAEARRKREAEAEAHRKEAEEEEVRREQEAEAEAEVRRKQEEEEAARHEQEAEVRRKQEEEKEARHKWEAEEQGGAKKGRKRKAVAQLVPEEAGAERRTGRKRLTPEEARLARERKQAATVATAKKPSYEYVEKSPVKAQSTKKQRT